MAKYGLRADSKGLPMFPPDETLMLLSRELNGRRPWLKRSEGVPADHLLWAAQDLGIAPDRAVEVLGAAGFRVPRMPEDACAADLELFMDSGRRRDVAELTFRRLFELPESRDCSLQDVVERFRAFGVEVPIVLPKELSWLDEKLFSLDSAVDWGSLRVRDLVPFARLIAGARRLRRHPRELARHLRARGIVTSCDDLPDGLTMEQACDLFDRTQLWSTGMPWNRNVDLVDLLKASMRTGHSMTQIAEWFREWGLKVSDVAQLVRDALARVPMADPS